MSATPAVTYTKAIIGKYLKNDYQVDTIGDQSSNFTILKKCHRKFDCLIFEMLWIWKKQLTLNMQTDSIRTKLFT